MKNPNLRAAVMAELKGCPQAHGECPCCAAVRAAVKKHDKDRRAYVQEWRRRHRGNLVTDTS